VGTTTLLTDTGDTNFRSVASDNGTNLWVSGSGTGVRYTTLGSTTSTQISTTTTVSRAIGIAGGQLYMTTTGTGVRLGAVGAGLPTTAGQTITNLPGFPSTTGSPYGFFFADLSSSVPGVDTVYVADSTLGLQKYSLVGGLWTLNGTLNAGSDSFTGLTGVANGSSVTLYAVDNGATLVALTDSAGYGNTFSSLAPTTLATAAANTVFRGVALLTSPVPEPGMWALSLVGLASLGALSRRRSRR
jgi:hypothetical protein